MNEQEITEILREIYVSQHLNKVKQQRDLFYERNINKLRHFIKKETCIQILTDHRESAQVTPEQQ